MSILRVDTRNIFVLSLYEDVVQGLRSSWFLRPWATEVDEAEEIAFSDAEDQLTVRSRELEALRFAEHHVSTCPDNRHHHLLSDEIHSLLSTAEVAGWVRVCTGHDSPHIIRGQCQDHPDLPRGHPNPLVVSVMMRAQNPPEERTDGTEPEVEWSLELEPREPPYVGDEGLLWCRNHEQYMVMGESGPDFRASSGHCGCNPARLGNHVWNMDRFYVCRIGRTWWYNGRPGHTWENAEGIILSQPPSWIPDTSFGRLVRASRLAPWADLGDPVLSFVSRIVDSCVGGGPLTADEIEQSGAEYCADSPPEMSSRVIRSVVTMLRQLAHNETVTGEQWVRTAALCIHSRASQRGIAPAVFDRSSPLVARPPGACVGYEGGDLRTHVLDDNLGIVRCREHGGLATYDACGPWGRSSLSCGCQLATCMHVVGGRGEILSWGTTWHTPGRPEDDQLIRSFVRMGCQQTGTPWWDGVTMPERTGIWRAYNCETDRISTIVQRPHVLNQYEVIVDGPIGDLLVDELLSAGINQLTFSPPQETGISRRTAHWGAAVTQSRCTHS
uniref:Uncharacterized protein n=1 Tax=Rhizoctonia cerealis phyllomonavirus TaxID=3068671 RepID=A0AA51BTD3_9MONO|nr:MAG: hypothetical protein [Rhizoctonia cerealis phyllomonavirus]